MENSDKKWYDNQFLTHLLLVFIFPVGLYALWKSRTIAKWWKVTATIIIAIIFIPSLGPESPNEGGNKDISILESPQVELTQYKLDSIQEVERLKEIEQRKQSTISARQLFKQYEDNEVLADKRYKDKYFYVEGVISDIGKDILDDIYVVLKTDNVMFGVQCYIDDEELVAQLEKGMKVTFHGKCDGVLGSVGMKNCTFVENLESL
ncbi:MAG: hypothetical protein ABJG47_13040 [Ekhidna sp.]